MSQPEDVLVYQIEPFGIEQYRDDPLNLETRFANFWAGVQYPARLITRTKRFSFQPIRKRYRQQIMPLDDVRDLVPLLQDDHAAAQTLIHKRLSAITRAVASLRSADTVIAALTAIASGSATADDYTLAYEGCRQAQWPWRWLKNYSRACEVMQDVFKPMGIDHYFLCWPESYMNANALAAVLKSAFLVPNVEQTPLPALFEGQYVPKNDYLAPKDPDSGQPFLRVMTAYDVRGTWDLTSWREVLMMDAELALCMDITTIPRAKAQRLTTDAYNVLHGALFGKNAVKDARSERAYQDVQLAMQLLDTQNLHEVSYALLIRAASLDALDELTQTIRDTMGARLRLDVVPGVQHELIKFFTTQPAKRINASVVRRNGLSLNAAAKIPWGLRKARRVSGTLWGLDQHQGYMPIFYDLFGERGNQNAHLMMLGKSDAGKTVSLSTYALRQAVAGQQVIIFDPVGKCDRVCEAIGGGAQYYDVYSDAAINPLDPIERTLSGQFKHVVRKLTIILGRVIQVGTDVSYIPRELNNLEMGELDRALMHESLYGDHGHKLATMTSQTAPLIETLITVLRGRKSTAAVALADELEARALGSSAHIYNATTTMHWDFASQVTAYNFIKADPTLLPMIYDHGFAAVNAYLRSPERLKRNQKLVFQIDEFGFMSRIPALRGEVAMATKTWRNFGGGMWSADQNALTYMGGDGSGKDFGALTASNTQIKMFGRQEGTDVELLRAAYGDILSEADLQSLTTSGPGEFVVIFGNDVHHLKIELTDQEYPFFIRKN